MPKPKILATCPLFPPARNILDDEFDVEYWTNPERIPRDELLKRIANKEALVCLLTDKIDEELLQTAPKLRIIATVSDGFDNVDVPACTKHSVIITHTPGVLDDTTADFAWALLLAVARRVLEADAWLRTKGWPGSDFDQMLGSDVWGKTLGIIGFGRIGRGVARRSYGFNMRVLYNDAVHAPMNVEEQLRAEYAELDNLLRESDFVSLHVPLLPSTRHRKNEADRVPDQYVARAGGR